MPVPGKSAKSSELAKGRFKQALRAGQIRAGAFLSQGELARLLDVPLGGLRDAMQVLEYEGFLKIMPRSGIQIVKADLQVLRHAFQLRRIIELEAVKKVVEQATPEELASWRTRHTAILEAYTRNATDRELTAEAIALDRSFHDRLVSQLRNPLITDDYSRAMDLLSVIRSESVYAPHNAVGVSMREHLDLIIAMEARHGHLRAVWCLADRRPEGLGHQRSHATPIYPRWPYRRYPTYHLLKADCF
jgi:DNA-binding GntR family transcriptional regulator